jgi:hypothetical protein
MNKITYSVTCFTVGGSGTSSPHAAYAPADTARYQILTSKGDERCVVDGVELLRAKAIAVCTCIQLIPQRDTARLRRKSEWAHRSVSASGYRF